MVRLKEDTGKRAEALALLEQALAEATATAADPVRAQALQLLGEIQQKQGRNQESAETFGQLVELTCNGFEGQNPSVMPEWAVA